MGMDLATITETAGVMAGETIKLKTNIMKKLLLVLLVLGIFSCSEQEELIQPSVELGIYQWELNENLLYVFGEYELSIIQDGVLSFDGNYSLEDGLLTIWDETGYSLTRPLEITNKGFLLDNMEHYIKISETTTYTPLLK